MTGDGATRLPKLPWTGGCQCGAMRYELTGAPRTLYACHCTECRRQSSSAFGLSLWVRESDFRLHGEPAHWARTADSGHLMHCFYCPHCGARLYHKSGEEPADPRQAILSIKAGTLDHARLLGPVGHVWTRSMMAGTLIPDDALAYDTQPDSFAALVETFSQAYSIPE